MEIKYEFLSSFVFENRDDIGNRKYLIHKEGKGDAFIMIERKLRRDPLPGMKQPTPSGAMLGWEASLLVKKEGFPAAGYSFHLYRDDTLIQEGRTDERGVSSLDVELPDSPRKYKLDIFSPIYPEDDSCNTEVEESDKNDCGLEPNRPSDP